MPPNHTIETIYAVRNRLAEPLAIPQGLSDSKPLHRLRYLNMTHFIGELSMEDPAASYALEASFRHLRDLQADRFKYHSMLENFMVETDPTEPTKNIDSFQRSLQIAVRRLLCLQEQNTPVANPDSSAEPHEALPILTQGASALLNFFHHQKVYATLELTEAYFACMFPDKDFRQAFYELELSELVHQQEGQYFVSTKGHALLANNDSEIGESYYSFLLHYFLEKEDDFFASEILLGQGPEAYGADLFSSPKFSSFINRLLQVPHPLLPHETQLKALRMIADHLSEEDERVEPIRFAIIMNIYLSRDLKETAKLTEDYIQRYISSSESQDYKDRYITLLFIYFEALEALERWDDIIGFAEQQEISANRESEAFPFILSEKEVELWLRYSSEKAGIVHSAAHQKVLYDSICTSLTELESLLPPEEEIHAMHPLIQIKLRLTLQRLYRLAYRYADDDEQKQQAIDGVIIHGEKTIQEGEINPLFLQPVWANLSIACRAKGDYEQALLFAQKAAIDRRGEVRELIDAGFILETVFQKITCDSNEESVREFRNILSYLSLERSLVPSKVRRSITLFINELDSMLSDPQLLSQKLQGSMTEMEIITRSVFYHLSEIGLRKANQLDTPYEKMLTAANAFDSLFLLKKAALNHFEGKVCPEYLNVFIDQANLTAITQSCSECDLVFKKHYWDSFLQTPPVDKIFRDYLLLHRLDLLNLLEEEKWLRGVEADHLIYPLQKTLLEYEVLINSHAEALFPEGAPQGLAPGAFFEIQEAVAQYE